jgi:ATP-dependent Clp protease ATP-binding subunit ClpC
MEQIEAIFEIELGELSARLAERDYRIRVQPSARRFLIEKGWDPKFGGRPLRRTIQRELEDPLAQLLIERSWPAGTDFNAGCRDGAVKLHGKPPSDSPPSANPPAAPLAPDAADNGYQDSEDPILREDPYEVVV